MQGKFEKLKNDVSKCNKCELFKTRTNVVFGDGVIHTDIMFIGEAPGQTEDETGLPFVGRSGKLLDRMLEAIDLFRSENIFITNIIKCRPPNNADPTPIQQEACFEHLNKQIELINPKIVVCVGRISAIKLINSDFKVTKDHGKIYKLHDRFYLGTYHPSALLRFPKNKEEAFKDFLILKNLLKEKCH